MRLRYIYTGVAISLFMLFIGCEVEEVVDAYVPPSDDYYLVIRADRSHLEGREGETKSVEFTVLVLDQYGNGVPNMQLDDISLKSGPGEIFVGDNCYPWTYIVTLPLGDTSAVFEARIGQLCATTTIRLTGLPIPFAIQFSHDSRLVIVVPYGETLETTYSANVLDRRGNGIPDATVAFGLLSGEAEFGGIALTDSNGSASAVLALDGNHFGQAKLLASLVEEIDDQPDRQSENGSSEGLKTISTLDGVPLTDTLTVEIRLRSAVGLHFLNSDTSFGLFTGLERLPLSLALRDAEDNPLEGAVINLSCESGAVRVAPTAVTDEAGLANVELELTGNAGRAVIRAEFNPLELSDEVVVDVIDRSPLEADIELIDTGLAVWANSTYYAKVAVHATDDEPVVGVPLRLRSELPNASDRASYTDRNGSAVLLYTPQRGGSERLSVYSMEAEIRSGASSFRVHQEPLRFNGELQHNQDFSEYRISFQIIDTLDQGVPGERVVFSTTLGYFNNPVVVTDAEGCGRVTLVSGGRSGLAQVNVQWRDRSTEWTVIFPAPRLNHIMLSFDTPTLNPPGMGGVSSTFIRVYAYDANGNFVEYPVAVRLELIHAAPPPEGPSFNNGTACDSILTANGIGVALLHSGRQMGAFLLRATAWRDSARTDSVSVILAGVAVVAGPPHYLDIDIDNDGVNAGGPFWAIQAEFTTRDRWRNPCREGWRIVLLDDLNFPRDTVYTDNSGRAVYDIVYNSVNTFDTFTITAEIQTPQGIVRARREHIYPLQEGWLELNVDPVNWMFEEGSEQAIIRCWCVLKDGHEVLINNAPVLFTSNRAWLFYWYNLRRNHYEEYYPEPVRKLTGVVDEENNEEPGQATVFLIAEENDIFIGPMVEVYVNASVEGYDDVISDPAFIFFTRR